MGANSPRSPAARSPAAGFGRGSPSGGEALAWPTLPTELQDMMSAASGSPHGAVPQRCAPSAGLDGLRPLPAAPPLHPHGGALQPPLVGGPSIFAPPLGNGLNVGGLGNWGHVFGTPGQPPPPAAGPAAPGLAPPPQLLGGLSHAFPQPVPQPWGGSAAWGGPSVPVPNVGDSATWLVKPKTEASKGGGGAPGVPPPPQGGYSLW